MNDIRENKPFNNYNVSADKPNVPVSDSILTGFFANSMNGGHNKPILFKQVMAGEFHKEYRLQGNFKLLTPKTPTYQNLTLTFRTFFVPNVRVWENAEKYTSQKGGSSEIKISEIPNLGGKEITILDNVDDDARTPLQNTTAWRDSYISTYIPRLGRYGYKQSQNSQMPFYILPKVSVLPLRGYKAIFNEFLRNKEYDAELQEYKTDTVTTAEWKSYLPDNDGQIAPCYSRARRNNSYYSDYRTELQGFETAYPPTEMSADVALLNWAQWESKIAEARLQPEMANLTDAQVIAKLRGSKLLTEGKVQLISEKTITLNYAAVTQNANNAANNITTEFQTMGTQGAYSYTNVDLPLYAGMHFNEEGYIHVIATISADTVFEGGFDRLELNVTPLDQYRPELLEDKKDVLYEIECGTQTVFTTSDFDKVLGFKRKYSEYFKLPNIIAGDMTSNDYYEIDINQDIRFYSDEVVITQKTFQFFETDMRSFSDYQTVVRKNPWQDYTDLLINKNQAVKNNVEYNQDAPLPYVRIDGQNQCFFMGKVICIAQLPVDESIKNNYTTWGEH